MSEVARGDLTPSEIQEKLEYLLSRYRRDMEIHKMKSNATMFETVVVTTADLFRKPCKLSMGQSSTKLIFV